MKDPWGSFVDAKVNLIEVLAKELPRKPGGSIWVSSVCDPYQQPEAKYKLTRQALQLLSQYPKFTISILTKSAPRRSTDHEARCSCFFASVTSISSA
jgi:DNA repair photolyase